MKTIELKSMTLRNWRGTKEMTANFSSQTVISGRNGSGKSRFFNAFCWLLFGKDSEDRKDFELRTYDENNNILRHCECSVEATLTIEGNDIIIKRSYTEQWVKPRGQAEEILKGNVTECTWDSVPVKVGEFQKRVKEQIIDESVFKMITNPRYFCEEMKWQLQRELLLTMAGTPTDEEIASGNKDFELLLDNLSGKSLTDYRKMIAAEKKRLKKDLDEIKPRIDQTNKMMPDAEDWTVLENEKKSIKNQIAKIDEKLESYNKMSSARRKQVDNINREITDLTRQQQSAVSEYHQQQQEKQDKDNEDRRSIDNALREANSELSQYNIDQSRAKDRITYLQNEMGKLKKQLEALRADWYQISARKYDDKQDICPTCGQRLPGNKILEIRSAFDKKKKDDLKSNNDRGIALSKQMDDYLHELTAKEKEVEGLVDKIKGKKEEIGALYENLDNLPTHAAVKSINNKDIPKYKELQEQIQQLDNQLEQLSIPTDNSVEKDRLRAERTDFNQQVDNLTTRLNSREVISKATKEISILEDEGKKLAQQIASLEESEYVATQFSKKKIEDCEQRINSMFNEVKFKLFDTTNDGNEFECCTPLLKGVPYSVVNPGFRVNMGLDIINTIRRFYNISAPIFCDNSESVNNYDCPDGAQMIYLKVTTGNLEINNL